MGSGQSKYGPGRSNRQTQYPYGAPGYPNPYGPYPPTAPYGQPLYPQPQQGFIPPGAQYGQGAFLPPPQLNWLPQDKDKQYKKRKSRRTQSERFVAPRSRRRSESHRRDLVDAPVIPDLQRGSTGHGPNQRAPTPFIAPFPREDEEDDPEDDEEDRPGSAPLRSSSRHSRYRPPSPIHADLANVIRPLDRASSAHFGPTGPRPRTPLSNPLPPPPRDLYEMTPYKSLLSLPQTTALLTATYGPQRASLANGAPLAPKASVKSKKGGLLRAFSRKDKHKEPEQPQVRFIPIMVSQDNQNPPNSAMSMNGGADLNRSQSQMSRHHSSMSANNEGMYGGGGPPSASPSSSNMPAPVPPIPSSPPAIRFDQSSRYAVFMNHSPHRVIWRNKEYPTALHLHEALKFLEHRPDLAERIRECKEIDEVYPLAASFHQFQRQDWGMVYLDLLKEVLYQKFRQHPNLRSLLLQTATARLIYVDAEDIFWGSGSHGNGQNQLGQALVEVRQRLQAESA